MAVYVECGAAGAIPSAGEGSLPVLNGAVEWSESVASGAASSLAVPGSGEFILSLTSDEDGYFAVHRVQATAITNASTAGSGGSARRRRLKSGVTREVALDAGFYVAYSTT